MPFLLFLLSFLPLSQPKPITCLTTLCAQSERPGLRLQYHTLRATDYERWGLRLHRNLSASHRGLIAKRN
jgi:hypothetical protein